jgi:hypothetical protein
MGRLDIEFVIESIYEEISNHDVNKLYALSLIDILDL